MERRQLLEFQDEPWFPGWIREGQIEVLSRAVRLSGMARALAPVIGRALAAAQTDTVLDLCSGAGGPIVMLLEALESRGSLGPSRRPLPRVVLTDLHPNLPAWERLQARSRFRIDFMHEPVDATRIPAEQPGELVTIVNALHHFPKETACSIVEQVVRRRSALFVAEAFPRDLLRALALMPALGVAGVINPFRCERHGLRKALASVPIPVLAVTGLWDLLASAVRIHEPTEIASWARALAPDYHWEPGEVAYPPWGRAVYLMGLPLPRAA